MKFPVKKGFHGFSDDSEEFLKPSSTNPRQTSASGVGYNNRWASGDDAGSHDLAGHGVDGADNSAEFLRASSGGVDYDAPHERLSGLIQDSQPYNPVLTGGAPLTKGKGIGPGSPRFAPKNLSPKASQRNRGSKGGV